MTKEELRHWLYDYAEVERKNAKMQSEAALNERNGHPVADSAVQALPNEAAIAEATEARPPEVTDDAPESESAWTVYVSRNPRLTAHDFHAHPYVELIYQYQGACNVVIEGSMRHLQKGDVCIVPPNVFHLIPVNESIVLRIQIRRDRFIDLCTDSRLGDNAVSRFASEFAGRKSRAKYLLAQDADHPRIRALIEQMISVHFDGGAFRTLFSETLFQQFMALLVARAPQFSEEKGELCVHEQQMVDILRYIRQNFRTVELTEVAAQFRYTPTHICRLLRRYTGTSFSHIVTQLRMESAVEMLERTDLPVQEIALRNGYESIEHFHRTFKSAYNQTPLQYRKFARETAAPRFAGRPGGENS